MGRKHRKYRASVSPSSDILCLPGSLTIIVYFQIFVRTRKPRLLSWLTIQYHFQVLECIVMVVCIVCVCVCGRVRTSLQLSSNPAGRLLYLPTVAARLRLWCFVLLWFHLYRGWWSATADARGRDGSLRVSANVRQRKWRRYFAQLLLNRLSCVGRL